MNEDIKTVFTEYFNNETNIVTPIVYGYELVQIDNSNIILFEKSTNRDGTLYGVNSLLYKPRTHKVERIDLNKSFKKRNNVNTYINSIGYDEFIKADTYGEVKKIRLM